MSGQLVKKLNSAHHAIAAWLVLNPGAKQGECAAALGYSEAWISRLINSDLFQAYYEELKNSRDVPAVQSLQDKMAQAGHLTLDHINAKLENTPLGHVSEKFLTQTAKDMLDRLGFGGKGELHLHQHNDQHVHLTAEQVNAAREKAQRVHSGELVLDGAD